jgi:hypothetical protein
MFGLNDFVSRRYYSDGDPVGGGGESAPEVEGAPVTPETPETPAAPTSFSMTQEQLDTYAQNIAAKATEQTIAQLQAKYEAQQRTAQQNQNQPPYDPRVETMDAVDLRTDMFDQALDLYPDATAEQRVAIRQELKRFRTPEDIAAAIRNKDHYKLARGAMAEFIEKGEYTPKALRKTPAPRNEPVGGGAGGGASSIKGIPASYVRDCTDTLKFILGSEPTEADIRAAWAAEHEPGTSTPSMYTAQGVN